jgi:hypothetical protein
LNLKNQEERKMKRFMTILFSVILAVLVALPSQVSAASVTETSAAIGKDCVASGDYSTAMGYNCRAGAAYSTAMGVTTRAYGDASTAMGYQNTASGDYSTAMGMWVEASGQFSAALGFGTEAEGTSSTVLGAGININERLINNIDQSFMVGYMAHTEDTTPEFFVKDGGVGVNTTSPSTSLHVKKAISGGASIANHVAAIENTSTGTSPDVLMLKLNVEDPGTASNFITFADSTKNLGSIEGNGSGGISLNTTGGDFAEYLPKANPDEAMAPGDIVGLFPDGLSKKTDLAQRVMVITTAPAVLGNMPGKKDISLYAAVAFLGQVPIKVDGSVTAGDYIE